MECFHFVTELNNLSFILLRQNEYVNAEFFFSFKYIIWRALFSLYFIHFKHPQTHKFTCCTGFSVHCLNIYFYCLVRIKYLLKSVFLCYVLIRINIYYTSLQVHKIKTTQLLLNTITLLHTHMHTYTFTCMYESIGLLQKFIILT